MKIKKFVSAVYLLSILFSSNFCSSSDKNPSRTKAKATIELSPSQISNGLLEGLSFISLLSNSKFSLINELLNKSKLKISLEVAYETAYNKKIKDVNSEGDSGKVFKSMKVATEHFQKILKKFGIKNYSQYILTSIDNDEKNILFAIIERKENFITVKDSFDETVEHSLNQDEPKFYQPYKTNSLNYPQDVVIDFGGVSKIDSMTQKTQSILLTLAANSVLMKKKSPEYWEIEKRWISGEAENILFENQNSMYSRIGVK